MASGASPGEPQERPTGAPASFRATKTRLARQARRLFGRRPHQLTPGARQGADSPAEGLRGFSSHDKLAGSMRSLEGPEVVGGGG